MSVDLIEAFGAKTLKCTFARCTFAATKFPTASHPIVKQSRKPFPERNSIRFQLPSMLFLELHLLWGCKVLWRLLTSAVGTECYIMRRLSQRWISWKWPQDVYWKDIKKSLIPTMMFLLFFRPSDGSWFLPGLLFITCYLYSRAAQHKEKNYEGFLFHSVLVLK